MNASEKREEIMEKIKASAANEKDAMAKANLILLLHWMNEINGDMSPIGEIEDLRVALIDKTKFINEAMPYAKDIDIKPLNDQLQLLEHAIKILNPPISWTAKEIFNGLNDETFDAVKNKLLEASITFGEFCYIRDIDTNELRKTLMKKIAATPTDSAIDKAN
jgi:hypothetical protein